MQKVKKKWGNFRKIFEWGIKKDKKIPIHSNDTTHNFDKSQPLMVKWDK